MTFAADSGSSGTSAGATNEILFTIPVGEKGITLRGMGAERALDDRDGAQTDDPGASPWGPAGLTVIHGSAGLEFIIGDAAGHRVLQYDQSGTLLAERTLDETVVTPDDLQMVGQELWLLDQAADPPQLLRFAPPAAAESNQEADAPQFRVDDTQVVRITLVSDADTRSADAAADPEAALSKPSISEGITGLALDDLGVLIEYGNGARLFRPTVSADSAASQDDQRAADPGDAENPSGLEEAKGYLLQGRVYSTGQAAGGEADPSEGDPQAGAPSAAVNVDDQAILVEGTNVRGVRLLGAGDDRVFYIVAEELLGEAIVQVDQTVRRYSADGTQTGIARIPLDERAAYVQNGLAVGPDGAVYALVAGRDNITVQRLVFRAELSPLAPAIAADPPTESALFDVAADEPPESDAPCRSRDSMIEMGFHYRDNRVNLTKANLDGNCPGRVRPRYLNKGPGEYGSVAYDWGGFDSVEQYNTFMAQGFQAGDIPFGRDDPPTACSKGVDCSGFVSRCWGLAAKEGTSTIHRVSKPIKISQLQPGDILNLSGAHVTLYHHEDKEGVWAFECTAWGERDRVIFRPHSWDYYKGYEARRFNNVC